MGERENPFAPGDFGGLRFADGVAVVDDNHVVGEERFADEGVHRQLPVRSTKVCRGHTALAAHAQHLPVGVEDADHAEVEPELVGKNFQNLVEDGLQITAARGDPGGLVKHSELLARGRAADVDRAEHVKHVLHEAAAGSQVVLDDDARRGGADRAGQGSLGKPLELGELLIREAAGCVDLVVAEIFADRRMGLLVADELGHQFDEFDDGRGLGDTTQLRCFAAGLEHIDEFFDLLLFGLPRCGEQGDGQEAANVEEQRPEQGVGPDVEPDQAEQSRRPQDAQTERSIEQQRAANPAGIDESGKQQGVEPDDEAKHQADGGSAMGGPAPIEPAEDGRGKLGRGHERDQADVDQGCRLAQQAVVKVTEQDDRDDGEPLEVDQQPGQAAGPGVDPEDQRHQQVVEDHGRQRHRFDHDHPCRSGEAADEHHQGQPRMAALQGEAQHEKVGIDGRAMVEDDPGQGQRDDEQGDQEQIGGEAPHCFANMLLAAIFHHHDVKLAGEEHDGHHGHEGEGKPFDIGDLLGVEHEQLPAFGEARQELVEDVGKAVEQPKGDENADHQERHDLQQ